MLSGGLDSAPIAALAARRLGHDGAAMPLRAISWVFDDFADCDERRYLAALRGRHPMDWIPVSGDGCRPLGDLATWPFDPNTPEESLYRRLQEGAYRAAREAGSTVVLSGAFGDDLYVGSEGWLWDLLAAGRPAAALRGAVRQARENGWTRFARRHLVRPLVPRRLYRRLRPRRPRPWLTGRAAGLLPATHPWPPSAARAHRDEQHRSALCLYNGHCASAETFHTARAGVEVRYPFRDRRLVELMLEVPAHQLFAGGVARPIVRAAMADLLPPEILGRTDKASFTPLLVRAMAEAEGEACRELLARPGALWREYVRPEWVARAEPGRRESELEELALWHCVCLELWQNRMVNFVTL